MLHRMACLYTNFVYLYATMADLIRSSALLHFTELVSELGGDADSILRGQRINPALVGDYDYLIPYTSYAAAMSKAASILKRPDFGLCLGARQGIEILGPSAVLIRHSETVVSAIEGVCRYQACCAPQEITSFVRRAHSAEFSFSIVLRQVANREQLIEKGLVIAMDAFRFMLGKDFVPIRVTMQHSRISPPERYREQFGCAVEFESDANTVHLPIAEIDKPIRGRDAMALSLAESYLARMKPELSLSDHVEEMVHRLLQVNRARLVVVAQEMGLHPRVLQRKLSDEGTSFERILDNVRREMFLQFSGTGMQVAQIATMLGYSEQSSFSRACRRWFAETPRDLITQRKNSAISA